MNTRETLQLVCTNIAYIHSPLTLIVGIWRSKEDARLGGLGPDHKKARLAARELYHEIKFSTWSLVVEDGAESLKLEEWSDHHG
jgi:hypothetical protein